LQGQTALFNAALGGDKATVERLLAAGAAIDTRDNFDDTPLIGACDKGNDVIARLLVERGADPRSAIRRDVARANAAAEGATFCRALPEKSRAVDRPTPHVRLS
jgi:ankyrin repeat protein